MPTRSKPSRRPEIAANFAVTADGKVATRNRTPSLFSSAADKRRLLEIRATGDALLVGGSTIAADNMTMGLPAGDLVEKRVREGRAPYPLRVILSKSGGISPALRVFHETFSPIILYTGPGIRARTEKQFRDLGVEVRKQTSLRAICEELHARDKVGRIVLEGGPTLFRNFAEQGLLDTLHLTHCPLLFGGKTAPTLFGPASASLLPSSMELRRTRGETIGGEYFATYRVVGKGVVTGSAASPR